MIDRQVVMLTYGTKPRGDQTEFACILNFHIKFLFVKKRLRTKKMFEKKRSQNISKEGEANEENDDERTLSRASNTNYVKHTNGR